jgi:cell division protease FtsH
MVAVPTELAMESTIRPIIFWVIILVAGITFWQVMKSAPKKPKSIEISYSQFLSDVDAEKVTKVKISNNRAEATYRDGSQFRVAVPADQAQLLQALRQKSVQVWYTDTTNVTAGWLLSTVAPFALIAGLWFFLVARMRMRAKSRPPGSPAHSSAPWQPR